MSKYDINQIRQALRDRYSARTGKFCKSDGNRDLVKKASGVLAMDASVPNSPAMFKIYISPITTFGPWDSYLDAEFDATNELIMVWPDFESESDDSYQRAISLSDEFRHDPSEATQDWREFLDHLRFSPSELELILEAIRRHSVGLPEV